MQIAPKKTSLGDSGPYGERLRSFSGWRYLKDIVTM